MDLIEKCESNNVEEVGYFLVANPEAVNQMFIKNFEEATPLHFAAQYGHLAIVNMLLKKGADPDIGSVKQNKLALHVACKGGFVNVVKTLFRRTKDVNSRDDQGQTPFHLACQSEEQSCINFLVEQGCDVFAQDEAGRTGLDHLLYTDNLSLVKSLLNSHPELMETRDKNGRTSFHYAAQVGAINCIRHMLQFDRPKATMVDNQGRLPVHYAALTGKVVLVKEFLERGVNQVIEADHCCDTVAHHAAKSRSLETLHVALEHGADLTIQNKNGNTVQHIACMNKFTPEMMTCLKNHGADFEALENNLHDTPVYSARKAANFLNYEKVLKNQLQCKYCDQREEVSLREASRQRLTVHKKISDHKIGLFDTPSDETTRYSAYSHRDVISGNRIGLHGNRVGGGGGGGSTSNRKSTNNNINNNKNSDNKNSGNINDADNGNVNDADNGNINDTDNGVVRNQQKENYRNAGSRNEMMNGRVVRNGVSSMGNGGGTNGVRRSTGGGAGGGVNLTDRSSTYEMSPERREMVSQLYDQGYHHPRSRGMYRTN